MPAELLLGHSPTSVYGHHLLYSPLVQQVTPISGRSVPPRIRPCLSTGSINIPNGIRESNDRNNNSKQKKRVVFADDRGRPLTQVRVMSEPSNMPPLWKSAQLLSVTKDLHAEAISTPWEALFQQPASDYLAFRRKLDIDAVSLENVIIREFEQNIIGTVKVKNLAYDKQVIVRTSSDDWNTHEDVYCTFVEQPGNGPLVALVLYDTFKFKITLPIKSDKIEFCVKYKIGNEEYWDNNESKNYVLKKRKITPTKPDPISMNIMGANGLINGQRNNNSVMRTLEATHANLLTWSEFASWQHLNNDTPYW